jgi:PBP1b-binding outer membrane lipoprotein LpoB
MKKTLPLLLLAIMFLQACSKPTPPTTVANTVAPTAIPSKTALATLESTPTVQPTVTQPVIEPVTHITIPSAGTSDRATAHDNDNALFFDEKKVKTGDEFYKNRFER